MRWRVYLLVSWILVILTSVTVASGAITVNISTNPNWTVANGHDFSVITVNITDSGIPVQGANVAFSVDDPDLGFVYPESNLTLANGIAITKFSTKTKAGTANISVSVNGTVKGYGIVNIDHDTPYSIQFLSYPTTATVGSINWTNLSLQDRWGNLVDNRNETEQVKFSIITLNDASRFWNPTLSNFSNVNTTVAVGNDGVVRTNISLGTVPGDTLIRIQPPSLVPEKTIAISRVADGEPYSMAILWDPSVTYVPADGNSSFVFTFILYDEFGNGLNNKQIMVNSSAGPTWGPLLVTTVSGLASARFGPYDEIFTTTVKAYAVENASVNRSVDVDFYDPNATNVLLTISPISMPSHEFNESYYAMVTTAVVDRYGKPVPDREVNITIANVETGVYNATSDPYLETEAGGQYSSVALTTDPSGYAQVKFFPGGFSRDFESPGYSENATGQCDIFASYVTNLGTTEIAKVTPIWKNYPYLSVSTWVDDRYVTVNDTINVSLTVKGDGFALLPKPIDLILCTNRGSSMLFNMFWEDNSSVWEDKMVYLQRDAPYLIEELNYSYNDRVGIVSFGVEKDTQFPAPIPGDDNDDSDDSRYEDGHYSNRTYSNGTYVPYDSLYDWDAAATIDVPLNRNYANTLQEVYNITPYGDRKNQNHVPMRLGLYEAIEDIMNYRKDEGGSQPNTRQPVLRAIVLLSDSDWNDYGDPIAGDDGSGVNEKLGYYWEEKDPCKFPESGRSQWTAFPSFDNEPGKALKTDPRQNLAVYAAENNIKIFPIAYFRRDQSVPRALDERFQILADTTGGTYYRADSGARLKEIFEEIGRKLRQEAGVNTTAMLNFSQVKLNNITVPGNQAFDYVYQENLSTIVKKWNTTDTIYYDPKFDQTADWNDDQKLNFDLGTMYLGDYWRCNFTLKAKDTGTVEFFGNGSEITFNNGSEIVTVPGLFQYTQPIRFGYEPTHYLNILNYMVDASLKNQYSINYTGGKTVHAKLSYKKNTSIAEQWRQFATVNYQCTVGGCYDISDERILNKWILGAGNYDFKLEAWADDTPLDVDYASQNISSKFFIWLK
jgi:hypothetical protein